MSTPRLITRFFLPFAAVVLGGACILEAAAGPTPTPQVIVVPGDGTTSMTPSPTLESILALTPTWTLTAQPTSTATTAPVTMTAGQDLSCVKGPHWILYEWVAGIAEGEVVTLLARSTADWPDYFYARKSNGTECWAFGASSTISGNAAGLPVREAPPLPTITFTVQNQIYLNRIRVFIRGKDATAWGADRTGGAGLAHGATFSLTLTAGFYDVQIIDHRDGVLYEKMDAPIGPEPGSSAVVLNGQYSKNFLSHATNDLCRADVQDIVSGVRFDLTIPGDGRISPGEEIALAAPGGEYHFATYRCGGGMNHGVDLYFGPAAGGGTINIWGA
jgi:hypothetical protein